MARSPRVRKRNSETEAGRIGATGWHEETWARPGAEGSRIAVNATMGVAALPRFRQSRTIEQGPWIIDRACRHESVAGITPRTTSHHDGAVLDQLRVFRRFR